MDLDQYLQSRNLEYKEFSEILQISLGALFNYRTGKRDIPLSLAVKIENLTHKKVTVYDLAKLYKKQKIN